MRHGRSSCDAVARGGFCAVLATSIDEAIRQIRDQVPDLVLVSCLLDGEAAETLLQEIDRLNPAPPVVLVGLQEADLRWKAWQSRRFVTVVRQPFTSQDVLSVVRTLLETSWAEHPEENGSLPKPAPPERVVEGNPGTTEAGKPSTTSLT